jgi:hypothetical protein
VLKFSYAEAGLTMRDVVCVRFAVAVSAMLIWSKWAFAEFCGDLQAALAASANFAKLRGAENGYNAWKSNVVITGAQSCNILADNPNHAASGSYSLYCSMSKLSSDIEGATEFSTLVAKIKQCAPQPKFSYRVKKTNNTMSFILDKAHRTRAHLTVIRLPGVSPADNPVNDAKTGTRRRTIQLGHDDYWLELVIIGQ